MLGISQTARGRQLFSVIRSNGPTVDPVLHGGVPETRAGIAQVRIPCTPASSLPPEVSPPVRILPETPLSYPSLAKMTTRRPQAIHSSNPTPRRKGHPRITTGGGWRLNSVVVRKSPHQSPVPRGRGQVRTTPPKRPMLPVEAPPRARPRACALLLPTFFSGFIVQRRPEQDQLEALPATPGAKPTERAVSRATWMAPEAADTPPEFANRQALR